MSVNTLYICFLLLNAFILSSILPKGTFSLSGFYYFPDPLCTKITMRYTKVPIYANCSFLGIKWLFPLKCRWVNLLSSDNGEGCKTRAVYTNKVTFLSADILLHSKCQLLSGYDWRAILIHKGMFSKAKIWEGRHSQFPCWFKDVEPSSFRIISLKENNSDNK